MTKPVRLVGNAWLGVRDVCLLQVAKALLDACPRTLVTPTAPHVVLEGAQLLPTIGALLRFRCIYTLSERSVHSSQGTPSLRGLCRPICLGFMQVHHSCAICRFMLSPCTASS